MNKFSKQTFEGLSVRIQVYKELPTKNSTNSWINYPEGFSERIFGGFRELVWKVIEIFLENFLENKEKNLHKFLGSVSGEISKSVSGRSRGQISGGILGAITKRFSEE